MLKLVLSVFSFFICSLLMAQDFVGQWTTYKNGEAQSEVEIYEQNGMLFGKIIKMINPPDQNAICKKCKGDLKDTPLVGLVIITDMKKEGRIYSKGTILNPSNGRSYSCQLSIDEKDPNILMVRGSSGPFSQTQRWVRIK